LATSGTLAAAGDYDYIYSSARDFAEIKGLVKIEKL
jgi:predicted RNA-binding protein with PUA-like domain